MTAGLRCFPGAFYVCFEINLMETHHLKGSLFEGAVGKCRLKEWV